MHWPTSAMSASSPSTPPARLSRDETGQRLLLAHRADPARDALAARLVAEERGDAHQEPRQVDGLVEHEHDPRAERRPGRARALERQRHVEVVRARGSLRPHRRAAPPGAPARRGRRRRGRARRASVAPKRTSYVPGRSTCPETQRSFVPVEPSVPVPANDGPGAEDDVEHVDERLDVVDDGRLAEEADLDRERRLVARLAPLALDRLEDRRLLAADVGARAAADLDVEREALAHHVVAEESALPRLVERVLERVQGLRVLAAQVEVAVLAARRVRRDRHRLDDRERVAFQQHAVLERPRLRLVGVAHEVVRPGRLACDGLPLDARREGGAAPAHELRVLDLAEHALRPELERATERGVAALGAVVVEASRVDRADPAQESKRGVAGLRERGRRRRARRATGEQVEDGVRGDRRLCARRAAPRPRSRPSPRAPGRTGRGTGCGTTSRSRPRRARPRGRSAPRAARSDPAEPWQRQARSSQTWTTRGGLGSSANSA